MIIPGVTDPAVAYREGHATLEETVTALEGAFAQAGVEEEDSLFAALREATGFPDFLEKLDAWASAERIGFA